MSKQTNNQKLNDERMIVRKWLQDGAVSPLVMLRCESYRPSAVLWPTVFSEFRQNWKSLFILIANALPVSFLKITIYRLLGTKIGRGVYIGPQVVIDPLYPELITLEDGCFLGMGCRLFTHEITATNFRLGRITVGAGSVVGGYATIRSGVSVGKKATIGFSSFANDDVADGTTVVGIPAEKIVSHERGS